MRLRERENEDGGILFPEQEYINWEENRFNETMEESYTENISLIQQRIDIIKKFQTGFVFRETTCGFRST